MKKQFNDKKNYDTALERIMDMECRFDRVQSALSELQKSVEAYSDVLDDIAGLDDYYSGDWRSDFSADENGELPAGLKRGVLSEDGLWNFFEENRELREQMQDLCDKLKKYDRF
ncbi:MAG: DUF4298 domain-containing protein [Ruminococcus sp.]|nr:DUF4298 domain-containing protein [Ruminococcus sp.]